MMWLWNAGDNTSDLKIGVNAHVYQQTPWELPHESFNPRWEN